MPTKRKVPTNDVVITATVKKVRPNFELSMPNRPSIGGYALVCGAGEMGQLGLGVDVCERKRPAMLEKVPNVVDICAGGMHNLILTADGAVYSFGCNDEGALGRPTADEDDAFEPDLVKLPTKALMISAGDSHSACLLDDGRVFAWGSFRDSHGSMGLTVDGIQKLPVDVMGLTNCTEIASGSDHLVVLTSRGKVYTFGCAEQGQLGRVPNRSVSGEGRQGKKILLTPGEIIMKRGKPVEKIWASSYCTYLRESNTNSIWVFGLNNYVQLIYNNVEERVLYPVRTNLENAKDIAGGQHHTLVLKNDGKCYAVGRGDYGRLGIGKNVSDQRELQAIDKLQNEKIQSISCGECFSFAVTDEGKLYSWGMGTNLSLGTGNEDDVWEPELIISKNTENKRILKASGGGQHSIFLVTDNNNSIKGKTTATATTATTEKEKITNKIVNGKNDDKKEVNNVATEIDATAKRGRKKK
ncbi:regulator of chromosome condensation-like [Teleopsis dalmanni]|uniref:regulator of chromosome condensation-like n=1 Tax=Teleopsis dalmanni TaxID=139649 RepID=UPI000D32A241|nr:regulator of chromosome condensation-like [Teleopsis dalmanni]XP_037938893.1 regulator of chromosome condensation-like [Teleopsis dalmanni]